MSALTLRAITPGDRESWETSFRGYRDFYGMPHDETVIETVWGWLNDPEHETRGIAAVLGGKPVGIAHFRTFSRPLAGSTGLYLDDLFTNPEARGQGVATALLSHLGGIAQAEGASVVRWITAESNTAARSIYDRVAAATPWVTYDLTPGA
ncbi:GNAT family N-acetyltransferase [Leucobacter komagatae]|uniref:Acetyltransferase n=1 Tax=Leucobacter komagatae TaxID=55969 RepID=A0A0D0HXJ1_9MICO|nr:GNAT family N-acetyltransferase [Leucobacter komagatae]KIP52341.1 acetyltransferase [Leucobacter komagatae]